MGIYPEEKVEITIDIDSGLNEKLEQFKEEFGVTNDDVLAFGICKVFKDINVEDIKGKDELDTLRKQLEFIKGYEKALTQSQEMLRKIIKIKENKQSEIP